MKIIVDNLLTRYIDEGNGPTVLFLHGWGDRIETFEPLISNLRSGRDGIRAIRLDLPGFGDTETPAAPWDLHQYVSFVESFLRKINVTPDFFVGHSFGGRILLKALSENRLVPAQNKIVLIASAGVAIRSHSKKIAMKILAKIARGALFILPVRSRTKTALRNKMYRSVGSDYANAGPLKETFKKIISEDLSDNAKMVKQQALLIWGDRDDATPIEEGRKLHSLIPNSEMEIFSGAGHFVHQQNSREVAAKMKEFLNKENA